jgi:cytoskeletal protein CcmA (bactofilin family)
MFGRRNPDRPLDSPLPEPPETDLNLDLLDDLPDILDEDATPETQTAPPQEAAPAQQGPEAPADPAWHASAPSILGPSVTRVLSPQAESPAPPEAEDQVPRTDLSSPPPRAPVVPVYQTTPLTAPIPAPLPPVASPPAQAQPAAAPASEPSASRGRAVAESVIGPDDFFDGRYRSERGVRIQGNARGSIESRQYIFVEAGAQVEADLSAEDITVSGDFTGKITCRRRLEVTTTGKIRGQVQTALLVVQEGGALDGELHMREEHEGAAGQ